MSFQTRKTFVNLRNTNEDIFEFRASIDSKNILTINSQKRSKDIVKIIHVTAIVQLKFYEAMRILFAHKKDKNNNWSRIFTEG